MEPTNIEISLIPKRLVAIRNLAHSNTTDPSPGGILFGLFVALNMFRSGSLVKSLLGASSRLSFQSSSSAICSQMGVFQCSKFSTHAAGAEEVGTSSSSSSNNNHNDSSSSSSSSSEIDEYGRSYATGRRKTSVARVWVKRGSGIFIVNDQPLKDYFQPVQREECLMPFLVTETAGAYDVMCTTKGGGMSGQAGAVRLGVSKALISHEGEYRGALKKQGFLTRDARRVERKKPGQAGARKKFQWVKR